MSSPPAKRSPYQALQLAILYLVKSRDPGLSVRAYTDKGIHRFQVAADGGLQNSGIVWGRPSANTQKADLKALKNETIEAVYFEHQDYKRYSDNTKINWERDSTSNIKQKWKKIHVAALRWQTRNFADIQAYQRRGNNNNDYKPNSQASKLARDLMNVLQQARRAPSKPKRTGNYKMLYRGITGAPAKKLLTEGVLVDKGFVATTPMITVAEEYAQENTSGIIMRIAISSIPSWNTMHVDSTGLCTGNVDALCSSGIATWRAHTFKGAIKQQVCRCHVQTTANQCAGTAECADTADQYANTIWEDCMSCFLIICCEE